MARGGAAVAAIDAAFPGAVRDGAVDRPALGDQVFDKPASLRRLEAIVHPLVRAERAKFLARARARRVPLVVLDIPLLFETGGEEHCDAVMVVTAPAAVQRARVLARANMTAEKFAAILDQQTPDREKRRRADFVVPTGLGKLVTLNAIRRIVTMLEDQRKDAPCPI